MGGISNPPLRTGFDCALTDHSCVAVFTKVLPRWKNDVRERIKQWTADPKPSCRNMITDGSSTRGRIALHRFAVGYLGRGMLVRTPIATVHSQEPTFEAPPSWANPNGGVQSSSKQHGT